MSARDDDELPLVELVAVDGSPIEPRAGADQPGWADRTAGQVPTTSRRTRLLAMAALVAVGAGLCVAALVHRGAPAANPVAIGRSGVGAGATGGPAPGAAAGTFAPRGIMMFTVPAPSGELFTEQQARARQTQAQQQLAAGQLAAEAAAGLTMARPDSPPACPADTGVCDFVFGAMPAAVLAAVTARLPHATPVAALDATGRAVGALYFRQLQVMSGGCVITMQLTRAANDPSDLDEEAILNAGSGRLVFAQHRAADGFLARFDLAGNAAGCPSDSVLAAIAGDPRLLAGS